MKPPLSRQFRSLEQVLGCAVFVRELGCHFGKWSERVSI